MGRPAPPRVWDPNPLHTHQPEPGMLRLLQGNVPGATRLKTQPKGQQAGGHCTCAWPALLTAGCQSPRCPRRTVPLCDPHMGTWGAYSTEDRRGEEGLRTCVCDTRAFADLTKAPAWPPTSPLLGLVPYFLSQGTMFLKEETKCVRRRRATAGGWDGEQLPRELGAAPPALSTSSREQECFWLRRRRLRTNADKQH